MVNSARALSIGLHPDELDYSNFPGLTKEILLERVTAGEAAIRAQGIDFVPCYVSADPAKAEAQIRATTADGPFRVAMIGAGIRMDAAQTPLFERLINALVETHPGIRLCFNTSPESTVDAIRRWL
ncbi:hypothetical protein AB0I28_29760 [Phytomonospora sp. NPDC050363]|uniref:hypothetical protein n=1 Tax=Phytomonospora sp. NPDC050363 TaxID=3155642 RepID=UPI0033F03B83